jgi:hypothetical protein
LESVLLKELIPQMKASWPEAKGQIHIDAWREVSLVDQFSTTIRDIQCKYCFRKLFLLTEDIKKMNLKNTIIRY